MTSRKVTGFPDRKVQDRLLPDSDTYQVHYLTRDALMEVIARNRDQCPQLEKTPCSLVRVRRGGSTL